MNYTISKKIYLFNLFLLITLSYELRYSSLIIVTNPTNSFIVIIILQLISYLLLIFIHPKINYIIKIKYHKILILLINLYSIIMISYTISYSTFLLNHWFYNKTPFIFILLVLILTIFLISKSFFFINYFGFMIGIFILIINSLPIFNTIPRNPSFLFDLNLTFNYKSFLSLLFICFEQIMYLTNSHLVKDKINKKDISKVLLFSSTLIIIFILENYFFMDEEFLSKALNPNLLKFKVYYISQLIDNIDFILLFNILYFTIFKASYLLNIFRIINNYKSNIFFKLIGIITTLFITIIFTNILFQNRLFIKYLGYGLSIILIVIYIIIKGRKIKNEKVLS